jgi:uncharacterized RDD family membrane protein YckC
MPTFDLVGPLRRLQALLIDLPWLLLTALPLFWAASLPEGPFGGWTLLGGLLLLSLGAVPCWMLMGATPGQLMLGQRVVDAGGAPDLTLLQALLRWLVGWCGLLPLGAGLLWMCVDPNRQGWHDKLARTLVVDAGSDATGGAAAAPTTSQAEHAALQQPELLPPYRLRHLRGELPLGPSLWVNGLLLPLPLTLLLGAIEAWTRVHGSGLRLGSLVLLLGWPLLLALLGWGWLGVWRASARPLPRPAGPLTPAAVGRAAIDAVIDHGWALGARLLMSAVLAAAVLHALLTQGPQLVDRVRLVLGSDPLGSVAAQVSADGRRLQLKGPLGLGDAARVRALLAAAPQLRWVLIESDAGRLDEALQVAALLRARQLPTRASGECSGVCPFVFLAGSRRQLLPGARLGFHRLSAGAFNPPYQALVNRSLRARLLAAGLTPHLATKALATPPTALWFADADELVAAGLLSVPERPLEVDLPPAQGAALSDYTEALSASPLWQALERRFAGARDAAAARMHAASSQGDEAVQGAGQEVVAALLPALLAQASAETRWLYTEILRDQIDALRLLDAAACRDLLLGEAAAHRRLPPGLAWREAEWLLGALRETPRATPSRPPSALELEVVRRSLGPRAPAQLAQLWRPAPGRPRDTECTIAHALLSEIGSLPAPERRLALRLMYERE